MNKLYLTIAAIPALALAVPAAAQYQANPNARGAVGVDNRIAQLEARLNAGIQAGTIDRQEARSLRQQIRALGRLENRYSRNGLTREERADLQQRIRNLRQQLRLADGRGDGRWNDEYTGQGGAYEEVEACQGRDGIGGVFGRIFGGDDDEDCAGLRVGQRAGANLGAVPSAYRGQFRDGGGVYYRSDGRYIYQIDARTHTVVRVFGPEY